LLSCVFLLPGWFFVDVCRVFWFLVYFFPFAACSLLWPFLLLRRFVVVELWWAYSLWLQPCELARLFFYFFFPFCASYFFSLFTVCVFASFPFYGFFLSFLILVILFFSSLLLFFSVWVLLGLVGLFPIFVGWVFSPFGTTLWVFLGGFFVMTARCPPPTQEEMDEVNDVTPPVLPYEVRSDFDARRPVSARAAVDAIREVVGCYPEAIAELGPGRYQFRCREIAHAQLLIERGIIIDGVQFDISPADENCLVLYIRRLFLHEKKLVLLRTLQIALYPYGELLSVHEGSAVSAAGLMSAIYIGRFRVRTFPPPNLLRVRGCCVQITYVGVDLLCTRCCGDDHLSRACPRPGCRNCGAKAHDAILCKAPCHFCQGKHQCIGCVVARAPPPQAAGPSRVLSTLAASVPPSSGDGSSTPVCTPPDADMEELMENCALQDSSSYAHAMQVQARILATSAARRTDQNFVRRKSQRTRQGSPSAVPAEPGSGQEGDESDSGDVVMDQSASSSFVVAVVDGESGGSLPVLDSAMPASGPAVLVSSASASVLPLASAGFETGCVMSKSVCAMSTASQGSSGVIPPTPPEFLGPAATVSSAVVAPLSDDWHLAAITLGSSQETPDLLGSALPPSGVVDESQVQESSSFALPPTTTSAG
jgi:hypothetical protein